MIESGTLFSEVDDVVINSGLQRKRHWNFQSEWVLWEIYRGKCERVVTERSKKSALAVECSIK